MFICYCPSFVVAEDRENKPWTESTTLDWHRERERERERAYTDFGIIFFFFVLFSAVVLARACSAFCLHIFVAGVGLLWGVHPKIGTVIFGLSLHYRVSCPNDFLFLFFILCPLSQMAPLFEFLPANQNPAPIFCKYISIFNPAIPT